MYKQRIRNKHKQSHTRHLKKIVSETSKTQMLPVIHEETIDNLNEAEDVKEEVLNTEESDSSIDNAQNEDYSNIFEKDDLEENEISSEDVVNDVSDDPSEVVATENVDETPIESKNRIKLHHKIINAAKNQKSIHSEEVKERNDRIAEAKQDKNESTQSLKLQKQQLKQAKQAVKQANKELKRAKKQKKGIISAIVITIFALVAAVIYFTVIWLFKTWPKLQMSELMYQLTAPLEGTGESQITNYIMQAAVPAGIVLVVVIVLMVLLSNASSKVTRLGKQMIVVISCLCIGIASYRFYTKLDLGNYVSNQKTSSDFIELNYVDPSNTSLSFPENKRNLIMIYLESMEMTYSDYDNGGGFETNYIPSLTSISKSNENFSGGQGLNGAHSLPYTTWTMAGLFASTSGLPLQMDIEGNSMDTQTSFFPNTTCLGDILAARGYNNYFACGSDATFGGRRLYFENHGNYTIHDINYRKENGQLDEDYYVWWGFEDSKLIEWAKEDLSALGESGETFNYTMLTVDTHFEDGYYCDLCEDLYGDQYADVITCSDKQVSELVSWIQEQPWYENTTIVITGDHPTMDVDFCDPVSEDYARRVYTSYINAHPVENNTSGYRTYSTFDTFPTTLSSLGVGIDGNKLGLGTNLFSGVQTLSEEVGLDKESEELSHKSTFMSQISGIDIDNAETRERSGLSVSANINITSYEDGVAHFTLDNLAHVVGTFNRIEMTLSDSDGNTEVKNFEYQGDGTYLCDMNIPNGNVDSVYLKAEVVSEKDDEETREVAYEYSGPLWNMCAHESSLSNYLEDLRNLDLNHYTIFMTTQGDASASISEEDKEQLSALGASSLVDGGGDASFTVIEESGVYARSGNGYIRDNGYLDIGIPYVVASSADELQTSSILLGWALEEYCPQGNGINIVIYDNYSLSVVSQTSFDTTTGVNPSGKISYQTSLLNSNVTLTVENCENFDGVSHVIVVVYDSKDPSKNEEITLTLNEDGNYETTLEGFKKELSTHTIEIFVEYDNYSRKSIGKLVVEDEKSKS